jgi:hypothetical protein
MRRALTPVLLPLAALVLTGCGSDATSSESLPAGVTEQYSVLDTEVAERGGSTEQGEWTVSYIVEQAEPWFAAHGDTQHFREPKPQETHHIEIIPTETATGRIVPDVPVTLEVVDSDGEVVDEKPLQFLHSTFFHYANNFEVPEEGSYTLRATLGVPAFARHGEEGERPALAEGAEVVFEDVELGRG